MILCSYTRKPHVFKGMTKNLPINKIITGQINPEESITLGNDGWKCNRYRCIRPH